MAVSSKALLPVVLLLACCEAPPRQHTPMQVEFLTRDGCAGSEEMRANLDRAVNGLGLRVEIQVVDVDKLGVDDYRTGYGTPTALLDGEDLLGLTRPQPSLPT